jgi:hypothetical protein
MSACRVPITLAYLFTAYVMASVFYMAATTCMGTPFKDSLTPSQLRIKRKAAAARGNIFMYGLVGSALLLFVAQPFASPQ